MPKKIKVILTVFQYDELPAQSDLHMVYNYFKKITSDVVVFTDIKGIKNMFVYYTEIAKDYISNLKEDINYDVIIYYYSGHGIDGNIIFPNKDRVSFIEIKNTFGRISRTFTNLQDTIPELFIILDCCYAGDLNLTYRLDEKMYKLKHLLFTDQKITLITSSDKQKAGATKTGSLFTGYLFAYLEELTKHNNSPHYLEKSNRSFLKLREYLIGKIQGEYTVNYVNKSQIVTICSSYLYEPIIPSYLLQKQKIDITYENNYFILRR